MITRQHLDGDNLKGPHLNYHGMKNFALTLTYNIENFKLA